MRESTKEEEHRNREAGLFSGVAWGGGSQGGEEAGGTAWVGSGMYGMGVERWGT